MVAALVLGTNGAIRGGSSPLPRTKKIIKTESEYLKLSVFIIVRGRGLEEPFEIFVRLRRDKYPKGVQRL